MADKTYYAWTEIRYDAGEDGKPKSVKEGETVTAQKLGVSKEDFDAMVESGSIRTDKYPEDLGPFQSPRDYYLAKARELEGRVEDEE